MRLVFLLVLMLAANPGFSLPRPVQTVTANPYTATLRTNPETLQPGKSATLDIFIMDSTVMTPSENLTVTASLAMPAMADMALDQPKITPGGMPGHYNVQLNFPQTGNYALALTVKRANGKGTTLSFKITPGSTGGEAMNAAPGMEGMSGMQGMPMKGSFGNRLANREGSGTSWQPDSSPMFMKELHPLGGFEFSAMGTIQGGYVAAGGKRGDKGFFSNSMLMLMGRRELGGGTLGLHFMTSLDPVLNGRKGVPNLLQNAFTVHDADVTDRKDPHNIFAELAVSYSHPLSKVWSGFLYGGPVGEPALGNVMYLHRTSGMEIPEAPISHDWFDGTHISVGVATLGLVYQKRWKLEGSVFNGHDPVDLYGIGTLALNSASGRLSYNPSHDWSFSASYGYLNSDVNKHRLTFGVVYSLPLSHGDNLSVTAYFGQNIVQGSATSNAWLAEATYYHAREGFFVRFERVDKGELVDVPPGNHTVNKLLFGGVHNFMSKGGLDYGLGGYVGLYSLPSALNASYGSNPVTFGVFLRIHPSKL